MSQGYVHMRNKPCGSSVAWFAFVAVTLLAAWLTHWVLVAALVDRGTGAAPMTCQTAPPGTALTDGDDIRARFLVTLCRTTNAAEPNRFPGT